MSIAGVLRKTVGGAIIPDGVDLYHGLAAMGQLVLVGYGEDTGPLADWLELHGLVKHAFISFAGTEAASELRREGYDIGLVVISDPFEAMNMIPRGFNTLLFTHAVYAQPDWRPDAGKGIRAWGDVVEEVRNLARMKADDARVRPGD